MITADPEGLPVSMSAETHRFSLHHDVGRSVAVLAPRRTAEAEAGVELMRYVYRPDEAQFESPRPYIHPLRTPGGALATVFRPWDHVWHKGITMALPNVGPDNFWGGGTYTRAVGGYSDLNNNGSQDHESITRLGVDENGIVFAHNLSWRTEPPEEATHGTELITEQRRITAAPTTQGDAWVLGWQSILTNVSGAPIELGSPTTEGRENAGYGGLFWRGPRSFTGGYLVGSNGIEGEELRGTACDWAGFSGKHDGVDASSTVVFVDLTEGQRLDTEWFARSEPFACLNPAPFFETVRVFEPGETLRLDYAVAIADGESDRERMGGLAEAARAAAVAAPAGQPAPPARAAETVEVN